MVQRHGGAHRQVANREIHHARASQAQLQQQGFRQPVHQGAVTGQAHHEKAAGPIPTGHQLSHPVGQHLIAEFAVLPEGQPMGSDLHGLLEAGLEGGSGVI